jgi:hypothetical protein
MAVTRASVRITVTVAVSSIPCASFVPCAAISLVVVIVVVAGVVIVVVLRRVIVFSLRIHSVQPASGLDAIKRLAALKVQCLSQQTQESVLGVPALLQVVLKQLTNAKKSSTRLKQGTEGHLHNENRCPTACQPQLHNDDDDRNYGSGAVAAPNLRGTWYAGTGTPLTRRW